MTSPSALRMIGVAMRWVFYLIALGVVLGVTGAIALVVRERTRTDAAVALLTSELRRLEQGIKLHAIAGDTVINSRGWPTTVDPEWFGEAPPKNPLLDDKRPWIEIAGPDEADLLHPPVRMAVAEQLAAFWYNPSNGVVRARVPVGVSDAAALRVYNKVNDVLLASIFQTEKQANPGTPEPKDQAPANASDAATKPVTEVDPSDGLSNEELELLFGPRATVPDDEP